MHSAIEYITTIIHQGTPEMRLIVLGISAFLEGVPVIGSIVPGGTIALLAGTFVESGHLSPLSTLMILICGSFAGDMIGYVSGKYLLKYQWMKRLVKIDKEETSWDLFDRNIGKITVFGKLIPLVRSTPSIFAGARSIKISKYAVYSFLGSCVWGLFGMYGGVVLSRVFGQMGSIVALLGLLCVSIIVFVVHRIKKSK